MFLIILSTILLGALIYLFQQQRQTKHELPLPPVPPGLPVLGTLLDIISASKKLQQHLLFGQYAKDFGEIVRVKAGPFTQFFVNSDVAANEIFNKQSAVTSERPRWIVSSEQICGGINVLLINASDPRWKHQRKVTHTGMTSVPRADAGICFLHYETAKFLHEVAHNPSLARSGHRLFNSIGRYTYSAFASQTFGMDIPTDDDPVIDYIYQSALQQILGTLPGNNIVDMIPVLDKLPLFLKPWEKTARALFKDNSKFCNDRLARVKRDIANGKAQDAFLPNVVLDEKKMGFETEEEAAYLSLMLIMGAADTSKMSTLSFLEAMMHFPEVQKKALHEIEKVVGDRLPVYEDLEKIPYVRCLMKETWRWRPPVALGHPHITTKDITCRGYFIPKGSRIQLNAWAIQHDPARYPDPERFWPERFENDHTTTMQSMNSPKVADRDHFAFGAGRRVCPGYHVAERSLAIAIMRIVWAFDIGVSPDAKLPLNQTDYPGEMPGNPGETLPVTLTLRSEAKGKVIDLAFAEEAAGRADMETLW